MIMAAKIARITKLFRHGMRCSDAAPWRSRHSSDEVKALHGQGVGPTEIAKRLGIGRASMYRVLD
jgi:transcriptional regulator of acetoin/glycerol metabolism